jgi:hypothetical protein
MCEKMSKNKIDCLPPSRILSDNSLHAKQENNILKITHSSKPMNLSPFSNFDLVVLEERKKVPHVYEDTKVLVAIQRIAELESECSNNPKSAACELLGKSSFTKCVAESLFH